MAHRGIGRKGIRANILNAWSTISRDASVLSSSRSIDGKVRPLFALISYVQAYSTGLPLLGAAKCNSLTERSLVRCFHTSLPLSLQRKNGPDQDSLKAPKKRKFNRGPLSLDQTNDEKNSTPRKGKYGKNKKRTEPAVDAPYVAPKLKRNSNSLSVRTIEIFEGITVKELAERTSTEVSALQEILINVGEKFDSEFDPLSIDVAELVAMEVKVNVKRLHSDEGAEVLPRPPVVTVMGHVDHGKTSLLDALRQTSVAAREAGGITQHVGAFVVQMPSGSAITFLDTPGHAAFSAMRARGAAVTDVVVLVVAADDGVMPQTLEAMNHAKLAGVPIVVAINKCDKPASDPERVKNQLATEGLCLEEMGGDVQVVEVSAKTKMGLDRLEEALLLQAEIMELKTRVNGPAQAYVVEARLDKGRGPLVTAIVKAGTLLCGKHVVVGSEMGKIRAIRDMSGKSSEKATPAMPVEIEGLRGLPMAGDDIIVVENEERAKMLSAGRRKKEERDRLMMISESRAENKEEEEEGEEEAGEEEVVKRVELPIIVKGDVQGTVQAVTDALKSLNSPQVFVNIVHIGVGPISQSDIDLAQACGGCIVGFNIRTPPSAITQAASRSSIKIIMHRVIYHLLEDVGNLIVEKAPGTFETQVAGEAEVLNIFELKGRSKAKGDDVKIAGCKITDGRLKRSCIMRLLRSGEVVFEGPCASLKREKQDVETVGKGNECGLVIQDFLDLKIGDVIQCLEQVNRKPKFISSESGHVRIEC